MELGLYDNLCTSRSLAATLLKAWMSGDSQRLLWELERMAAPPSAPGDVTECERMEILAGIAAEMRACPDLFAPRTEDARAGVWLGLLDHLSGLGRVVSN